MRAILCALSIFAAHSAHAQVLATVGNTKISVEEFKRKLEEVNRQAMNPPSAEQFLEDLVRFEVGVQEAEKLKIANDPIVRERFRQVLYNSPLEKELGKKTEGVKITESEMKEYYKKNPEIHVAHILIALKPNASEEEREATRKRALNVLDDVKKSKGSFEDLAKLYSEDGPTKEMGGDLGFQTRATLPPSMFDTAVAMKDGEIKGLPESQFGFHILKVVEKRGYDLADKRLLRAAVGEVKRNKMFNDYFDKIKKAYKVEVNRDALRAVTN